MGVQVQLRIEIAGDVVERQELLNGTESVTIEGADERGEWMLVGAFSWSRGLVDDAGEGDLTLSRADGDEIFATLTTARVVDAGGGLGDADHSFVLTYEIDGGAGAYEGAVGDAAAEGSLAGPAFRGVWTLFVRDP